MLKSARLVYGLAVASLFGTGLLLSSARADDSGPLMIQKEGSLFYGGSAITAPGTFVASDLFNNAGDTFQVDSGYAAFQIPVNARRLPIVMWHGGGQNGKTFEDPADRENYQSILLRHRYSTFILDEPRRGKAGLYSFSGPLGQLLGQQLGPPQTYRYGIGHAVEVFRLGNWTSNGPIFFPGLQYPKTMSALTQLAAQTQEAYPEDYTDLTTHALPQSPLFDLTGPAILLAHSYSGGLAFRLAITQRNIRAIVAYEAGSSPMAFPFPAGESNPPGTDSIPLSSFMKLTQIPIQIYYGDNLPQSGGNYWQQQWRNAANIAKEWTARINHYGGDAHVTELPDIGLHGNTHFPFADLNNHEVAEVLFKYLRSRGLNAD